MLAMGVLSCQDQLEEKYINPEQTTTGYIEKFFTRILDNDRVRPAYWNMRTFIVMHPGVYAQTVSFTNNIKRYQQQLNYTEQRWADYFAPAGNGSGVVAHYREMQKLYNEMSEEDRANAEVYMKAASVIYLDQTAQMVDLWGDLPFSEAGRLNLTGEAKAASFDEASAVYEAVLRGLEEAADYFATASVQPVVQATFSKQDILLKGNIEKWRRYANSLRLRYLMRISFINEQRARTEVLEMLANPGVYPLVDDSQYNVLLEPNSNYTDNMRNALTELNSHVAPEFMVESVLRPAVDPRMRVLFDKNVSSGVHNPDYYSMPVDETASVQEENISKGKYAVLDSSTFLMNTKMPGIVFSSPEVYFLKAEAFERWGSTAEAQTAYETGIRQSIGFYFSLNSIGATSRGVAAEPSASEAEITTVINALNVVYAGSSAEKQQRIWTQKWLHFGLMQSVQGWAELRRTNYPQLTFVPDNSTPDSSLPPSRLVYPSSEKTYNPVNYAKVQPKDTPGIEIFWDVN